MELTRRLAVSVPFEHVPGDPVSTVDQVGVELDAVCVQYTAPSSRPTMTSVPADGETAMAETFFVIAAIREGPVLHGDML